MFKKFAAGCLALLLPMTMMGCSSNSAASDTQSGSDASASGDGYSISMLLKTTAAEYWQYVIAGANAYTKEHPEVKLDISGPPSATSYDEWMNALTTMLGNDDIDAFILSPLQSDSAAHQISGETRPIITVDTDIDAPEVLSFVGTGNLEAATSGAEEAAKKAAELGWKDITCVALTGAQGDSTHEARVAGFQEGIKNQGGTYLETQYCDAVADRAATAMEGIIQKYPEGVAVIMCTNDDMGAAAKRIINDSGNENFKNTVVCGFDGTLSGCTSIRDGGMTMTIAQNAYDMGYLSVETAVKALEGEKVDRFVDSGSGCITQDNVDEYIDKLNGYLASVEG